MHVLFGDNAGIIAYSRAAAHKWTLGSFKITSDMLWAVAEQAQTAHLMRYYAE